MRKEPHFYVLRFNGEQWVIPRECLPYVGGSVHAINRKRLLFKIKPQQNSGHEINLAFTAAIIEHRNDEGKVIRTEAIELKSVNGDADIRRRIFVPALQRNSKNLIDGLRRNLIRNKRVHRVLPSEQQISNNTYRL